MHLVLQLRHPTVGVVLCNYRRHDTTEDALTFEYVQTLASQADCGVLDPCDCGCAGAMEDVIEVMKLLCYEMMEVQRLHQDGPIPPNTEVIWQLLVQQVDPLVVLLTLQTGQVRQGHCRQHRSMRRSHSGLAGQCRLLQAGASCHSSTFYFFKRQC